MLLDLTALAQDFLADIGYDPLFGVRPLKRALQQHLLDPLALRILEGSFKEGAHILADLYVSSDTDEEGLVFQNLQ
jgi:ATP-dependent Clp protease ATP-binding subunit ClpB